MQKSGLRDKKREGEKRVALNYFSQLYKQEKIIRNQVIRVIKKIQQNKES
jgi:hypothetical protein